MKSCIKKFQCKNPIKTIIEKNTNTSYTWPEEPHWWRKDPEVHEQYSLKESRHLCCLVETLVMGAHWEPQKFVNKITGKIVPKKTWVLSLLLQKYKFLEVSLLPYIFNFVFLDDAKTISNILKMHVYMFSVMASLAIFIKIKHHHSLFSLLPDTGLLLARSLNILCTCHIALWCFMFESEASSENAMSCLNAL